MRVLRSSRPFLPLFFSLLLLINQSAEAVHPQTPLPHRPDQKVETTSFGIAPNRLSGAVLVRFRPEYSSVRGAVHAEIGAEVLSTIPEIGVEQVRGTRGQSARQLIDVYSERPEVEFAEENGAVSLQAAPNDPLFPNAWDLNNTGQASGTPDADIDATDAWDLVTGGATLVAVLDSGVDYRHPDLIDNIWTNPGEIPDNGIDDDGNEFIDDVHGWNFLDHNNDPMDFRYHGTHVSGIFAAVGNNGRGLAGINWTAKILPVKFFRANAEGSFAEAAQAILYASQMGARVSNNSWGISSVSQTIEAALKVAYQRGMLFVTSAGNEGRDNEGPQTHYPCVSSAPNVICVAATDRNDRKAEFSNWGAHTVHLGAPGVDILSTTLTACFPEFQGKCDPSGYKALSGTSMAAPHVAGAAALLLSKYPNLTVDQLKKVLLDTVDPLPSLKGITVTGGRLNIHKALRSLADLSISLTGPPDPVAAGVPLTETINVFNHGLSTASAVDVTVTLPPDTVFISASAGPQGCSGTNLIRCRIEKIDPGGTAAIALTVTPAAAGSISYQAEVAAMQIDPDPANNRATAAVTVVQPEAPPPPSASAPPPANGETNNSGGGGCVMTRGTGFDPTLIGLFVWAVGGSLRKKMGKPKERN